MVEMDQGVSNSPTMGMGVLTIAFVIVGLVSIYYMYTYIYKNVQFTGTNLVTGKQNANLPPSSIPASPPPLEGGEYSVNVWMYISSFNSNLNTLKHVFEIQGGYFSTLLIALGAFRNTLVVRTHTDNPTSTGSSTTTSTGTGASGSGGSRSGFADFTGAPTALEAFSTIRSTTPSNVEGFTTSGSLSKANVDALFAAKAMDDSLVDTPPPCDLPEIDLQRWTLVTVVLSGRTTDVYLDGKLHRSCGNPSYYRVDPTGVTIKLLERGGFDGYIGNTSVANYAMNPDEIYRTYLSGPNGATLDILKWIEALFRGAPVN